jgi:hypothetical protein
MTPSTGLVAILITFFALTNPGDAQSRRASSNPQPSAETQIRDRVNAGTINSIAADVPTSKRRFADSTEAQKAGGHVDRCRV